MNHFVEQVLRMAKRGWRLFPVKPREKQPLVADWPHQATNQEEHLRFWIKRFTDCNWGLATGADSGVFVLDVDGEDGAASIQELRNLHPEEWTETLAVKTARGMHLYFEYAAGAVIRNSASKLARGLDVRGAGGYVLVPPSVHPSGAVYQWAGTGENMPVAPAPAWLIEVLSISAGRSTTTHAMVSNVIVPEGQRNARLTSLAGTMRRQGITPQGIEAALLAENVVRCLPPLPEAEVCNIARSVSRYQPAEARTAGQESGRTAIQIASGGDDLPPRFSEEALALLFSDQHEHDLQYVSGWGRWMCWDGMRWREDDTLSVFDRARAICRAASAKCSEEEKREKAAARLAAAATVAAVERLARADRRHAGTIDQWDADAWLLNTPAGTVNLRTGELCGHRREQYLTKLTAAGPAGPGDNCPLWLRFLGRVTADNVDLQAFLQRVIGYCLTGITREHALFFMYGTGANGKSVFLSTVAGLLGDYARTAPASAFTANNTEHHPTDVAGLRGARFVTAIETEDGRWWAESKIKSLTGGDRITARFMRQDFFEYVPQFKLIVAGNHRPGLRTVDEAMRRRLHFIPFTVTIEEQERDPDLAEKLKAEYPGILRWAIEGCLAWQQEGLKPPAIVRDATADYLAAEDAIGRWIDDRCISGQPHWTAGSALFADWKAWCDQTGERPGSQKRFAQLLENHGIRRARTDHARGFEGIALRATVLTHMTDPQIIGVPPRVRERPEWEEVSDVSGTQ